MCEEIELELQLAEQYFKNNCLNEAQQVYQKILELQSQNADAIYGLGKIAQKQRDLPTAEQFFSDALIVRPRATEIWFDLGNLYYAQSQPDRAEQCYLKVIELQPNLVSVYNNLGYVCQLQDKATEAIAWYQKALEIESNCVEAEVSLAGVLHSLGKLSTERQLYYAAKNNYLAVSRKVAGDRATAVAYLQQAIALQPDCAVAYFNLGTILQEQGKLAEAIECCQQALIASSKAGAYRQLIRNKLKRIYRGQISQKKVKSLGGQQIPSDLRPLKIAFVSQYCDSVLPPYQNSVGACTYGVVGLLAECCEVITYGIEQEGFDNYHRDRGVVYKLLSPSPIDLWLLEQFPKYAKLGKFFNSGMLPPVSTSNWTFPRYGRDVAKDLAKQQCDVIVFQHTTQYIPIVRALNPQAKIILNLHHERYPQSNRAMLARRIRHVDLVTCVSDHVAHKTRQDFNLSRDRCQTVYNGIELGEFAREKDYERGKQREFKRIMYAGAVSPEKGVHVLFDAFEIVVRAYPEVELEIYGPLGARPIEETLALQTDLSNLKSFYAEDYISHLQTRLPPEITEKIAFLGMIPRPQLIERFFEADIFVFPSLWDEGFGIPPVEAMAAGTPVVAARSGAVVETVEDGKTGFSVKKNNAPALAAAILKLLKDDALRESMGRAAQERALKYFTWERCADRLLQLCS